MSEENTYRSKPLSIAFLLQYFQIGGVETKLLEILRRLDRRLLQPSILCARTDGARSHDFQALKIPIVPLPGLEPINRAKQFRDCLRVLIHKRFCRYDIVVSFVASATPFECYFVRMLCRQRFVLAIVSKERMGRECDWRKRVRYADAIISLSNGAADFHFGNSPARSKVHVVYNGVDTNRFRPGLCITGGRARFGLPERRPLAAYVARLAEGKGHGVLLQALRLLRDAGSEVHVAVAGQDKLQGWFQGCVLSEKLQDHVTYLGPVHDIPSLLAVSDFAILASPAEGCGNAVLEALASGLPVVVTKSGADEFVRDGQTGYVVPVGDAAALADRMQLLACEPSLRQRLGSAGRDWVSRNCSAERMAESYQRLFVGDLRSLCL